MRSTSSIMRHSTISTFQVNSGRSVGYIATYFGYCLWLIALAFFWDFEEPNKLNTVFVVLLVFGLGLTLIFIAQKWRLISAAHLWIFIFILKLTLSFFITYYFWMLPLSPDNLRTEQKYAVQDSNVYDLEAKMLAEEGSDAQLIGLWLDFGIVRYLDAIYKVFGVSVLYVSMFNGLLSLAGFIALAGFLKQLDELSIIKWQWISLGMLLPHMAYYDATPSKEPLTHFAFYVSLLLFTLIIFSKKNIAINTLLLFIVCLLLGLIRLNVLMLIFALFFFFIYREQRFILLRKPRFYRVGQLFSW